MSAPNKPLQGAIDHLRHIGFVVNKHDKLPLYDIHRIGSKQYCPSPSFQRLWPMCDSAMYKWSKEPFVYTVRAVLRYAKDHSSSSKRRTSIKRNVKKNSKGRNRTIERIVINRGDIEAVDERMSSKKPTLTGNIWDWD